MDVGRGAPGPGGPEDTGDDACLPAGITVPDDASALEADRLLWLAEVGSGRPGGPPPPAAAPVAAPNRTGWRRLVFTRRWDRFGLSGPIVTLCLLATAAVAMLAVVLIPAVPGTPVAATLSAASPMTVPPTPGTAPLPRLEPEGPRVGHRLPRTTLLTATGSLRSQELRPAVLLLVPADATVGRALESLEAQTALTRVRLVAVATGSAADVGTRLGPAVEALPPGATSWAADPQAVLERAVGAQGLTAVLVRDDGRVSTILRDVPADGTGVPDLLGSLAVLDPPDRT